MKNTQTTQVVGGSPQTDSTALLLKTTPTRFIENGEMSTWYPPRAFTPMKVTLYGTKGEK